MSSGIIDIIREQIPSVPGIELATVVQANPLMIRLDNDKIPLSAKDGDLLICAHLMPGAIRYVSLHNKGSAIPDQVTYNGQTYEQAGDDINTVHTTIGFLDRVLKVGDRIVVMALPGGQQYLIWDKVVVLS